MFDLKFKNITFYFDFFIFENSYFKEYFFESVDFPTFYFH